MSRLKKTGLIFLILAFAAGIYYGSYRFYLVRYGNEDKKKYEVQNSNRIVAANQSEENKITNRTKLFIEYYNRKDGRSKEVSENMPVEYIGMRREELVNCLQKYESDPDVKDITQGFEQYQVLSFSREKVVLRKTFYPPAVEYKYYLQNEKGCVTVYYIDKKTVFEYTNIIVDNLPEEIKKQINRGKYITDIDSLYDFLENYSS